MVSKYPAIINVYEEAADCLLTFSLPEWNIGLCISPN